MLEIGALSLNGMERGELTMIDVQEIARGGAVKFTELWCLRIVSTDVGVISGSGLNQTK